MGDARFHGIRRETEVASGCVANAGQAIIFQKTLSDQAECLEYVRAAEHPKDEAQEGANQLRAELRSANLEEVHLHSQLCSIDGAWADSIQQARELRTELLAVSKARCPAETSRRNGTKAGSNPKDGIQDGTKACHLIRAQRAELVAECQHLKAEVNEVTFQKEEHRQALKVAETNLAVFEEKSAASRQVVDEQEAAIKALGLDGAYLAEANAVKSRLQCYLEERDAAIHDLTSEQESLLQRELQHSDSASAEHRNFSISDAKLAAQDRDYIKTHCDRRARGDEKTRLPGAIG